MRRHTVNLSPPRNSTLDSTLVPLSLSLSLSLILPPARSRIRRGARRALPALLNIYIYLIIYIYIFNITYIYIYIYRPMFTRTREQRRRSFAMRGERYLRDRIGVDALFGQNVAGSQSVPSSGYRIADISGKPHRPVPSFDSCGVGACP